RLIGQSVSIMELVARVKQLSTVRSAVLLIGEDGTGKTAVAELLHSASGAPAASFARVDCAQGAEPGFRENLLAQNGEGGAWIKQATGGTLFLQHLDRLPRPLQPELVSMLRGTAHGFRLICATSADLERLVGEGAFHAELFYRVATLPVQVPPLRERSEDIPLLVKHYAAQAPIPAFALGPIEFSAAALTVMMAYHWPGNL